LNSNNNVIGSFRTYQYTIQTSISSRPIDVFIDVGTVFANSPVRIEILSNTGQTIESFGARHPADYTNMTFVLSPSSGNLVAIGVTPTPSPTPSRTPTNTPTRTSAPVTTSTSLSGVTPTPTPTRTPTRTSAQ
jgi:hypothetical protein